MTQPSRLSFLDAWDLIRAHKLSPSLVLLVARCNRMLARTKLSFRLMAITMLKSVSLLTCLLAHGQYPTVQLNAVQTGTNYSLVLEWNKLPTNFLAAYKLYQSSGGSAFVPAGAVPPSATNMTVFGLTNDVTYRFHLTALYESRPSNVVTNRTSGPPVATNLLYLEAEAGSLVAPMVSAVDANASGGRYVSSPIGNSGTVSFPLTIPKTATYVIWTRNLSPNSSTDSFWVNMDGASEIPYGTARGSWSPNWQWTVVSVNDGPTNAVLYPLSAGNHKLRFRGRDKGTKLDRILVTTNRLFNPNKP